MSLTSLKNIILQKQIIRGFIESYLIFRLTFLSQFSSHSPEIDYRITELQGLGRT